MSKKRRGFTLIEVSLFMAITAVIFVGIVMGTQNSIFQQRYNDAVQSFADFLRNNYSQITNVQSDGTGNTDYYIFGRLISFSDNKVVSYSVMGKKTENAGSSSGGNLPNMLTNEYNVYVGKLEYDGRSAGLTDTYTPKWGSKIQKTDFGTFSGAILIVRHPETGSVYTYVTDGSVTEGDKINFTDDGFNQDRLDLCVNPNGDTNSDLRKDVRIVKNAKNASGVVLVPDNESACKK